MINKVLKQLFSMTSMGVLVAILAVAMAVATFIEAANGGNPVPAKALIYNARWFEIAIFLVFINIVYNIFRFKLYVWKKLPVFLFHVSFLIIILGAALTRYVGSEGSMHIREGATSNTMSSYDTYFYVEMEKDGKVLSKRQPVLISHLSPGQVNMRFRAFGNTFRFKGIEYVTGMAMAQMSGTRTGANQPDALRIKLKLNGSREELLLRGYTKRPLMPYDFNINGVKFSAGFGTMEYELPFALRLVDFQLERYPGSMSPSSFASEVVLIDREKNIEQPYRIFMNNILEHRGYRFYQSSYDAQDEKGTILSVNHDKLGTTVTYFGYTLMILTMVLALFARKSRFVQLVKATRKGVALIVILLLASFFSAANAQNNAISNQLDRDEIKEFGKLWLHSTQGRFMPVNTMAQDIVKKISGSNTFEGMPAEEFWLRAIMNPVYWESQEIFKVESPELSALLGFNRTKVPFSAFFRDGQYILTSEVNRITASKPNERTALDKIIMKLDEKLNVFYMAVNGYLLTIFPHPTDTHAKWYDVNATPTGLSEMDSLLISNSFDLYIQALQTNNYADAAKWRKAISDYQEKAAGKVLPSDQKKRLEILYNKILVFERLAPFYATVGIILLIIQFIFMFRPRAWQKKVSWVFSGLLFIAFLFHTLGLGIRWYVSGHAPMSNGYESMIFVAWGTLLAGFFIVRRSQMAMALTGILAAVALFVAHLSWMSPEITPLVPVLKSIWLTIHVAVIMTSYSFLGLGALIGLVVIVMYIMKTRQNNDVLDRNILHLTKLNEIVLIVGLYLITIGCFLGAIWANEAWGRYWGWDPKETWALVSILVYTFVVHMKNIKGLGSAFSFNVGSVLGFSSIIMTYFGVNYFLGGMHSYAGGDSPGVPFGTYVAVIIVFALIYWANFNQQRLEKLGVARKLKP